MSAAVFAPALASRRVKKKVGILWADRAAGELEASVRFERLARELGEVGAREDVCEGAAAAARDELKHHRLCAAIAASYGVEAAGEVRVLVPRSDPALPKRLRVLLEMVALSCIGETVTAILLAASEAQARASDIRAAVRAIVKDELVHSRLGWAHLAAEVDDDNRRLIAMWLPRMLDEGAPVDLFEPTSADPDEAELRAFGCLPRTEVCAIVDEALAFVVFPGFERLGIDTSGARAWIDERRTAGVAA